MLKRITALLLPLILLSVAVFPCLAQENITNPAEIENSANVDVSENTPSVENDNVGEEIENENLTALPSEITEKQNAVSSSGVPSIAVTRENVVVAEKEIEQQKTEAKERTFLDNIKDSFIKTFIKDGRWKLFLEGFRNTILIALCSTLLGVLIGMIIAVVKVLHVQMDRPNIFVNILNVIFNIYTTVIRGTPAVVQLFIAYYIIFKTADNYILVSIFAFGINSGAYVSEIVRGGIMSIDKGQLEAGRSLGLSYLTTMIFVVLPQAIKNILPALGNEFILLLKDTSIAGYIGTLDLMKAGNIVRSRTFEPYFSLLSVAAIYLVCVIGLEQLIKYFERRFAKSDRN